jgi:hypothetical protein
MKSIADIVAYCVAMACVVWLVFYVVDNIAGAWA